MNRIPAMAALASAALFSTPSAAAIDPPAPAAFEIDDEAAFKAAGFRLESDGWHACDDPGTASYLPGQIETIEDLNGDGEPEVVISESSSFCFGFTGMGYYLVSRAKSGDWKLIDSGTGIPMFLSTRGKDNWPDLAVGGPGFCFPVMRWDGKAYVPNRHEYEGKPCRP